MWKINKKIKDGESNSFRMMVGFQRKILREIQREGGGTEKC